MKTVKKNITYFSYSLTKEQLREIEDIAIKYRNIKNYFYSRYSGIRNYIHLFSFRKDIRDVLIDEVKDENVDLKLPARYWKQALDEAISNIKANWSNTLNEVRKEIKNNDILADHEKHYLMFVLKSREDLHGVLNKDYYGVGDERFNNVDHITLNRYLRRVVRKNKNNIPYSENTLSFNVDADSYNQKVNSHVLIQSLTRGKRISIPLNTPHKFNKTIRIKVHNGFITLSEAINIKKKKNNGTDIIGIDKNYENVIATSEGNTYGEGINKYYNEYSELIDKKYKKRNKIGALLRKHEEKGNTEKVKKIRENNLGKKKIERKKNRVRENFKSLINHSINEFMENENPKEIVMEDLSFQSNKKKNHKLHNWCKGYLQERIDYKSEIKNISTTKVNAAYTSQQCSACHYFYGQRDVVHCPSCGRGVDSHLNSAKVVLMRSNDKDIAVWMKPNKVKSILMERNERMSDGNGDEFRHSPTVPSETQEHGTIMHSGSEMPLNS